MQFFSISSLPGRKIDWLIDGINHCPFADQIVWFSVSASWKLSYSIKIAQDCSNPHHQPFACKRWRSRTSLKSLQTPQIL
jgi:hypothetical protein